MGLIGKIFSSVFGKNEPKKKKKYNPEEVRFVEQSSDVEKTMHIDLVPPKQQYIIKIQGQYMVFSSKEDMPPELRHHVEEIEQTSRSSSSYVVIVDGKQQHYQNIDDIPFEVRTAIAKSDTE
ncbi:MAG: hypothetical protein A2X49_02160 [Lentisphaerae bacterium GWF2_52_8]|nr:MAG: hypothetical protein A2X49_02160 [Lentisphaerae bacterium GWF2_52_8]